jgi:hypothetical protein
MIKSEAIANIINDDSFVEAMKELKQMHLDMICNSDVDEDKVREIAYLRITTINEIIAHLESIAANEKITKSKWKI